MRGMGALVFRLPVHNCNVSRRTSILYDVSQPNLELRKNATIRDRPTEVPCLVGEYATPIECMVFHETHTQVCFTEQWEI